MNLLSAYPFTILPILLFLFFLYKQIFSDHHSTTKTTIPSPRKLPIIGNLHQIDKYPHRSLHYLSQQHGDVMLLHFGRKPVLVVSPAKAATQIMKTHDIIFCDRPSLSIFKKLLYNCKDIATAPYGDYWRQMRSICALQLVSQRKVQSFHHVREEEIAILMEEIKRSSMEVNLSKMFSTLTSDLLCRVAFGMKCNGERYGIDFKKLLKRHKELLGGFYVGDFVPWLAWINRLNGVEAEVEESARDMDRFLEGIIQEHLDGSSADDQGKKDEKMKDFRYLNCNRVIQLVLTQIERASKLFYWICLLLE